MRARKYHLHDFPVERTQKATPATYDFWEEAQEGERMVELWYELSGLAQKRYEYCRKHKLKWVFCESMLGGEEVREIDWRGGEVF